MCDLLIMIKLLLISLNKPNNKWQLKITLGFYQ